MEILELLTRGAAQTRAEALSYWTDVHPDSARQTMAGSGLVEARPVREGLDSSCARLVGRSTIEWLAKVGEEAYSGMLRARAGEAW